MNMNKDNHCILIDLMGVCSAPNADCTYYKEGAEDCWYYCNHRCCHAVAIGSSTKRDRRSRERTKDYLKEYKED